MTKDSDDLINLDSPEAFAAAGRALSARMHYLNRVAMGESVFASQVAEAMRNLCKAFELRAKDPEVSRAFGDGWTQGTMSDAEKIAFLSKLILEDPNTPVPQHDGRPDP